MDRSKLSQALSKAIAYKQCGQQEKAELWAIELIRLLGCAEILSDQAKIISYI